MSYQVIVVGVGSMGAATCWRLARKGINVLGLEQGALPNPLASFAGATRAIRLSYTEHPDYVPLLRGAYRLWDELGEEAGDQFLVRTGAVYLGRKEGYMVGGALRAAVEHRLEHELLTSQELGERWPQFQVKEEDVGLFEKEAGYVLSERAVGAMVQRALLAGAKLKGHVAVTDWRTEGDGVVVKTDQGDVRADRVVFTAGAWSGKVLEELKVSLKVTRQVLGWTWPQCPMDFTAEKFPVWVADAGDGAVHYGFPLTPDGSGGVGLKSARHFPALEVNPDRVVREALEGDEDEVRNGLCRFVPSGDGPLLSLRICLYTNTPDGHFVVDHHPECSHAVIACGFSGHGFKFASVMGEALADLAVEGKTDWPIDFLGLSRFADA